MSLLALPVLLPIFGAVVSLVLGQRPVLQRLNSVIIVTAMIAVAGMLVALTDRAGLQVLWFGAWPVPLGINLVVDRLSALMLLISAVVELAVLVYSFGQDIDERRRETPLVIFFPAFLILTAGVSYAFTAGDLFNLFVGFEVLLFSSYVLLTMGGTGERIRAGSSYVVVNLLTSSLFLVALAMIYAATGTVNLALLAERLPALPPSLGGSIQFLLLAVFGTKAAVFPLSAWLPDSYPTAPGPVTAVFAGLLTKVGVYSIIRTQTLLFPHRPLHELLLVLALLTMVVGIMGAIAQSEIKRMLSFTLVSHIGYMIMGVGLATGDSLAATVYYTAHHILVQTALFLVVGLIARLGGSTLIDQVSGLAVVSPTLGALYLVPAMNLSGIPPLSGFLGKVGLLQASAEVGGGLAWLLLGGAVLTSLLTLYAMAKVWNRVFWGCPADAETCSLIAGQDKPGSRIPQPMVWATLGLLAVSLLLTFAAGWLYDYAGRAAAELYSSSYVDRVLDGVIR